MFSSNTSQVSGGYEIQRSLRFNSADSAYLNRTPASAGNRRTWTWSGWVKRSQLSVIQHLFSGSAGNPTGNTDYGTAIRFDSNNNLQIFDYTNDTFNFNLVTTQVFRDVSAWYHMVVAMDDTQATASNRLKVYVNGSQITAFDTATYPAQNTDYGVNSTNLHALGALIGEGGSGSTQYLSGYMTEVNFIDGQALTPSSFGAVDAQTGVWGPTPYGGSYGANGFYLNFSDNSNATAATLGKDYSGNGNNWTPNNFSVSAGAGNDSLVDVPTNWGTDTGVGGSVRGNYCTLNPLSTTAGTYTQGNLRYVGANQDRRSNATIPVATGQWYWEVTLGNAPVSPRSGVSQYNAFGFGLSTVFNSTTGPNSVTDAVVLGDSGYFKNFSGSWTDGGTAFASGDVLSIAVDLDANTFTFRRNNTQITTGTIGGTAGRELVPIIISYNGDYGVMDCNFGQRPFAYTAPSGFKALNTQNLPTPTIGATTATQAGKFFNPVLYTGNGFPTSGTQSVSGVGFQPDWVWIKSRSSAGGNTVTDVVRGINSQLLTNTTGAQETNTDNITAFNSDGFSLGSNTTGSTSVNVNGQTYVAWAWAANGAGVTNTAGSITSTVSANTTSGFSVVTYAGNSTLGATIGHGLGAAPSMIIVKSRSGTTNWVVYHASTGNTKALFLNTTSATDTDNFWNNTSPTSTVFSVNASTGLNSSGSNYVAYCFAEVPGFSKFGSYTGNGSADGPFVFCGFRPRYVLVKGINTAGYAWTVYDTARDPSNVSNKKLFPNSSDAESGNAEDLIDIVSNGFKMRSTNNKTNDSGVTYIFMALAEAPQKFALAR